VEVNLGVVVDHREGEGGRLCQLNAQPERMIREEEMEDFKGDVYVVSLVVVVAIER